MRVLVIYAVAGIGHKKAAEAIYNAFGNLKKQGDEVLLVNALDCTNKLFGWLYPRLYLFLVRHLPNIWGFFYYILDNRAGAVFNKIGSKQVKLYIYKTQPDIVITTHFFPTAAVAYLKKTCSPGAKLIAVITDLYPHYYWLSPEVDMYIAGAEETRIKLIDRGVAPDRINVFGIPVDMKFSQPRARSPEPGAHEIFTILFAGGGFGIGPIERMVKEVTAQCKIYNAIEKIRIIIVCGSNRRLYDRLSVLSKNSSLSINTFGFVDDMDEIMDASELIVTKPGGITIFEAMAKHLPIIAVYPIPGQEKENARLLVKYGAGIEITSIRLFRELIVKLIVRGLGRSSQYIIMKKQTQRLAKPDSAERIARLARKA